MQRGPATSGRLALGLSLVAALMTACTAATRPASVETAGTTGSSAATTTTTVPDDAGTSTRPGPATTATTTATTVPTTTVPPATAPGADPAEARRLARTVLAVGLREPYVDESTAAHLAAGGRSVFLSAVAGSAQVRALTSDAACAAGAPVITALRQDLGEGLEGVSTTLPTLEEAQSMTAGELTAAARRLGDRLVTLGINLNLAPAVDLAAGADPDAVAGVGAAFIAGLAEAGVGSAVSHFPGRTTADSGDAMIDGSADDLAGRDLVPFEAAVAAGVPVVVLADAVFPAIDPDAPASRSPAILALLRDSLGFDGVALAGPGGGTAAALAAGIDLVVVDDPAVVESAAAEIAEAVRDGRLPIGRLAEAAARVDRLASSLARVPCVTDG
jgi:beta-N-acetylhexosaminidase